MQFLAAGSTGMAGETMVWRLFGFSFYSFNDSIVIDNLAEALERFSVNFKFN